MPEINSIPVNSTNGMQIPLSVRQQMLADQLVMKNAGSTDQPIYNKGVGYAKLLAGALGGAWAGSDAKNEEAAQRDAMANLFAARQAQLGGASGLPSAPSAAPSAGLSAGSTGQGLLGALLKNESGNRNIDNTTQGTSSGQAQGNFQITTGTWNDFAPRAGIDLAQYPTPHSAPWGVQAQVASTIPLGRWDNSTLSAIRNAGYQIDPSATLGQNVKATGGDFTSYAPATRRADAGDMAAPNSQTAGLSLPPGQTGFGSVVDQSPNSPSPESSQPAAQTMAPAVGNGVDTSNVDQLSPDLRLGLADGSTNPQPPVDTSNIDQLNPDMKLGLADGSIPPPQMPPDTSNTDRLSPDLMLAASKGLINFPSEAAARNGPMPPQTELPTNNQAMAAALMAQRGVPIPPDAPSPTIVSDNGGLTPVDAPMPAPRPGLSGPAAIPPMNQQLANALRSSAAVPGGATPSVGADIGSASLAPGMGAPAPGDESAPGPMSAVAAPTPAPVPPSAPPAALAAALAGPQGMPAPSAIPLQPLGSPIASDQPQGNVAPNIPMPPVRPANLGAPPLATAGGLPAPVPPSGSPSPQMLAAALSNGPAMTGRNSMNASPTAFNVAQAGSKPAALAAALNGSAPPAPSPMASPAPMAPTGAPEGNSGPLAALGSVFGLGGKSAPSSSPQQAPPGVDPRIYNAALDPRIPMEAKIALMSPLPSQIISVKDPDTGIESSLVMRGGQVVGRLNADGSMTAPGQMSSHGSTAIPPGVDVKTYREDAAKRAQIAANPTPTEITPVTSAIRELPSYKEYTQAVPTYNAVPKMLADNSSSSVKGLVDAFGKILNPGRSVTTGAMQIIMDTQSIPDTIKGEIKHAYDGESDLSANTKLQMASIMRDKMEEYRNAWQGAPQKDPSTGKEAYPTDAGGNPIYGGDRGQQTANIKGYGSGWHPERVIPTTPDMVPIDENTPVNTAQTMSKQGQAGAPAVAGAMPVRAAPAVGTISKGHRFLGGDPSSPNSWAAVQ